MSGLFGSTTIKGTRITDFAQTSANVGQNIPFLYGRAPVNGNVIFAALPPKETRSVQRQGKGGVKQEVYTYSTSYAIAFCRGPILGYWWIKRNGKVVYSQDPNAPIEDQAYAAKWAARVMMYNGTMDQLPNSTIESYKGSGRVSAFRGLSYVVLPNEDVTEGGGAIPSYEAVPIAAPAEVWVTSKPYAQIARDSVNTGARLAEVTLLDFLKTATASESEAIPTFRPTSGTLFEVAPPEHNDFAAAQFVPAGGELKPPPTGTFKDNAAPAFVPTNGSLAVPPLGTVEKNDVAPGFAPTGGTLSGGGSPFAAEIAADTPVAWWRFSETSGTTAANIGSSGIAGTYTGGYTLGQPSIVGDPGDAAVTLGGTSGHITAGTSSQLNYASNFTWMAVIRTPATLGQQAIMSHGQGGFLFRTEATGKLHVIKSYVVSRGESTGTLAPNTDYIIHVSVATDGTTKIYINGVYDSTVTPGTDYGSPSYGMHIGADVGLGSVVTFWGGQIDEAAIFNTELSAARIAAHAASAGF